MTEIKVARNTDVKRLSTSIQRSLDNEDKIKVRAMGAEAVNRVIKAISIVNFFNKNKISVLPNFSTFFTGEQKHTVIEMIACRSGD